MRMRVYLRIIAITALSLGFGAAEAKAAPSLADQFNTVDAMMQGTVSDPSSYFATYASKLMEGLESMAV
jgi:hypothetical protein